MSLYDIDRELICEQQEGKRFHVLLYIRKESARVGTWLFVVQSCFGS